ncbi:uncharacterized protein LOC117304596 isoform X2 [Asterias rubens]|uniref:uncharacterized protein LOC117304596 isoform X2 n=1 Tax=Asterias rubens TaxID=7604 RepID=UPI0014559325|nr:uncharacterized protein LOC117304596 isoform X2 [Asterias rubens]
MLNYWSRVYPNYNHKVALLINHRRRFINRLTNLNWLNPVKKTLTLRPGNSKKYFSNPQLKFHRILNYLRSKINILRLGNILIINQGGSKPPVNQVKLLALTDGYHNQDYLDRSMASRINKQAAKRKHKASEQAHTNNPQHTSSMSLHPGSTLEKHVWGESPVDEDGCSVLLEPETGSVLFRAKIRCQRPPSPDSQDPTAATNSMPIKSDPLTSPAEVTDDDLTITALGNIDIFEPDSVSDFSINSTPTTRSFRKSDEELGIDPSLVKAGLERTRSLGDATRAQDASKGALKGAKTKKRKRKGSEKVEESTTAGAGDEGNERKTKRLAPNFFVAVQVSNPQIHEALRDVQQTVVSGDEKLKDAMVPIATLHLTIMVMHLATEEDVERAKEALDECHQLLSPRFEKEKLSILFGGLGHFNNQVMFAKIKDQDNILEILYEIADTVEKCFSDYNLVSTGERGFKPHLTVMKLSRAPSLRKKGVRRIKSELYKAHSNQVFGEQVLEGLQLCSINKPKTVEGYYCKAAEVLFGDPASRLDRDIHTIAEGVEPSTESNQQRTSKDPSETSQTTESVNRMLGPEEPMDLNNCESTTDKSSQSLPGNQSSSSDGHVNKVSDGNHEHQPHPVCDSAGDHPDCTADQNGSRCDTITNGTVNSSEISQSSPSSNGTTAEEQLNHLNNEKCSRSQSIQNKGIESSPVVVNGCCNEESFNGNHQDNDCKTLCENPSEKVIK